MTDTIHYRPPQELASRLEISGATLRRWSEEFAAFLSEEAHASGEGQTARYTDADLATLITVKSLMAEGLSYDQARERLGATRSGPPEGSTSLVTNEPVLTMAPAIAFISDTLHNVADSQQAVLNSQAANRELLGVVLQDNFNLKEENARLRERMLDLERQIAQLGREQEARREAMRSEFESRVAEVRHMVTLQSRSGCLGGLFGGR